MINLHGKLKENDDGDLCIDDIPVIDLISNFKDKDVFISISENDDEED